MAKLIPLQAVHNQRLSFRLENAVNTITIESRNGNLYLSLSQNGERVIINRALKSFAPMGYGLQLVDLEGAEDPTYDKLGTRFQLWMFDA